MAMPCTVRKAARYRLANYLRGAHLASRPRCLWQCRAGDGGCWRRSASPGHWASNMGAERGSYLLATTLLGNAWQL